jgi:branched-chain amino acid aminotransferase
MNITMAKSLDWANLPFKYMKTDYNVRSTWKNGKWGPLELSDSEYIPMHIAATCLHYGQEAFEGLKAYTGKDGKIRIFRPDANAKRMIATAEYIFMQPVPEAMFLEAVKTVVDKNRDWVPPYGSGASLYIRPLLIGSGARIGVQPADEYTFLILVAPTGPYFKEGFKPVSVMIDRDHDRAAPLGTGHIKVGGNYAASLISIDLAHKGGYAASLYLDSGSKQYIDECGPANFFGIKNNTYITPYSHSILPSITNDSLCVLAKEMGLKVERRKVPYEELSTFEEAGECGTAAVITPIGKIFDATTGDTFIYGKDGKPGPWSEKLYNRLRAIQYGDAEDPYGWVTLID